jgi:hypothetical protein
MKPIHYLPLFIKNLPARLIKNTSQHGRIF